MTDVAVPSKDLDKQCPRCGCSTIEHKEHQEYGGQTTWADGLGSPGPLWFKVIRYTCKACGRMWQ